MSSKFFVNIILILLAGYALLFREQALTFGFTILYLIHTIIETKKIVTGEIPGE